MRPAPSHRPDAVPVAAGIGLRHAHVAAFLTAPQPVPWLEVHSENYLCPGGPRLAQLERIRAEYPLSCHSVALSLGAAEGVSPDHLARLRALYDRFQPGLISDHLAWCGVEGMHAPDLLPLPLNGESLDVVVRNVERVQEGLGRRLLVENPSLYLRFQADEMDEADFLAALAARTGCGLLLDINNLYVSCQNCGRDAASLLARFPAAAVGQYHLAGHTRVTVDDAVLLVDDHGSPVSDPVWALYSQALRLIGPRPTLVEWDTEVPPLPVLLGEAAQAQALLGEVGPC